MPIRAVMIDVDGVLITHPEPGAGRSISSAISACHRSGFAPDDMFFIDDRQDNVDAARARGWHAARWTGETTLTALLARLPQSSTSDRYIT